LILDWIPQINPLKSYHIFHLRDLKTESGILRSNLPNPTNPGQPRLTVLQIKERMPIKLILDLTSQFPSGSLPIGDSNGREIVVDDTNWTSWTPCFGPAAEGEIIVTHGPPHG